MLRPGVGLEPRTPQNLIFKFASFGLELNFVSIIYDSPSGAVAAEFLFTGHCGISMSLGNPGLGKSPRDVSPCG